MTTQSIAERRQRHIAFWNRDVCERPLLRIYVPSSDSTETSDYLKSIQRDDINRYWTDPDILLKRALQDAKCFDLDDSIPALSMPIGPTMLATFLGSRVEFSKDTVWLHPCTDDLASLENITFDPNNKWWKMVEDICHITAREAKLRGLAPVIPDLGGTGDNLAALVGNELLLEEMLDRPELVKKILARILAIMDTCYKQIYEILGSTGNGTSSWLSLWSPGKIGVLQNDLSVMLSSDMYKEFFNEEFLTAGKRCDHNVFHLDGNACRRHLHNFLLEIPGLGAVQLGSNPGTKAMEVLPEIKLLQDSNKSVFTYVFPDEIEELFSQVTPRGFCMVTSVASNVEAEDILRRVTLACKAFN